MNKQKQTILVTGGTGFIGSNLSLELVNRGYRVRVFDNNFRGKKDRLPPHASEIEFFKGDIRDEGEVMAAARGVDIIYHLAFINGTRHFYEVPDVVLDVGVRGALNSLKAAIQHNVKKYILASSSEVYQTPETIPTKENVRISLDDITNPRYSYAGAKIISELLAINCLRNKKTECIIFRPHNVFGPDMGWEHVIPELMKKIYCASGGFQKKEIELPIQGTGKETRAFCYIVNAVDAIILCGDSGADGEIYHVGEMREIQIIDLVGMMADFLNMRIKILPGDLTRGSTFRRCPDVQKICKLGFKPRISFEEGLKHTLRWYVEHLDSYHSE